MRKFLFYILLLFIPIKLSAQYVPLTDQKAKLIWEIQKYLIWENDQNLMHIVLGTYNCSPEMLKALEKYKPSRFATGINYVIKNYKSLDELGNCQMIYIEEKYSYLVPQIMKYYEGKPTVVITDQWYNKNEIQINLFEETSGQKINFEYNTENISKQGVSVLQEIDQLGGIDLNAKKLLKQTKQELKKIEQDLQKKNQELQAKMQELDKQKKKIQQQQNYIAEQGRIIEKRQQEIIEKEQEINKQKQRLQEVYKELMTYQQQLQQKMALIKEKEQQLNQSKQQLNEYKSKIAQQQKQYQEQARLLEQQKEKMKAIEKEVEEKQKKLKELNFTITMQRLALMVFFVLLVIIVVLLYFIFKNYKIQKQQNVLLRQQKEEIEAQAEQLEKLSIVASETSNAVSILLPDGRFEWINAGFTRLYGYTLQMLEQKYDNDITRFNPHLADIFDKIKAEQKSITIESPIITRERKTIWIQSTLTPIVNNGEISKIILIDSDITKIKEAEAEIRRKNEQIMKQAKELEQKNLELAKLSIVAENTDNGVIIADNKGQIEWVNPGFERMLDMNFEEFKKFFGTNIIFAELPPATLDKIAKSLKNKQSIEYSFKLKTPKGKLLWLQSTLTPMFDKNGKLLKLFSINADITELKLAHDKIEKQNRDITKSIQYAQRIQQAALPAPELINELLPKHFILYLPRDIVSGDFYWLNRVHNKILFTAADCTGHGVPGAFMSMLGIAFLNEIIAKLEYEQLQPNIVLNILREYVIKFLRQTDTNGQGTKDGMDMALCMLDLSNEELHFAGANNPLWLIRDNQLLEFNGDDMPIGIYYNTHESFTNHTIKYQPGDKIYIFSDGYADQFGGPRGKKFMIKRFRELIKTIHDEPLEKQKEILYETHLEWRGKRHQLDDILVMGIEL